MAESVTLVAEPRQGQGTRTARRLRQQGKLPAIVYGHKEATVSVTLNKEDVEKALRHGARVVELKADGKVETAQITEVQWDHLGKELLHIDFKRVSKDERIVINVRLELRGQAPGVTAGGVLDQPIHSLSVECLAISVPESIRVNIAELQIGSVLHVRDLMLPEGVKTMADPDQVVLQVKAPVQEAEAAPVVPTEVAPGGAEPEVITRRAAETEEAE